MSYDHYSQLVKVLCVPASKTKTRYDAPAPPWASYSVNPFKALLTGLKRLLLVILERRKGPKISCPREIAYTEGFIELAQRESVGRYGKSVAELIFGLSQKKNGMILS